MATLSRPATGVHAQTAGVGIGSEETSPVMLPAGVNYTKFTNQEALGHVSGEALRHSQSAGADQLRGLSPMNNNERSAISVQPSEQSSELRARSSEEPIRLAASESLVQIEAKKPTLADVRARLAGQKGKKFWRSVDELAETPEFAEMVAKEFPSQASEWIDPVSRRSFLKVMGASMALAGLAGCTKQPDEPIYPYVTAPEDLILGRPVYFASAFPFASGAVPVLVKSDAYRPIKVDGNPEHPYVRGGSDPITQATLLDLYDPDRSQHVLYRGDTRPWVSFLAAFRSMLADKKPRGGQGLYFLSTTVTSPTLAAQWQQAQKNYPQAKFVQYEPVNRDNHYTAAKQAFGSFVDAQYRLDQADVIVSLDADLLGGAAFPGFHKLARDYAQKRKLQGTQEMNRLYVVESVTTMTGFKAEHRLAVKPSQLTAFAQALANAVAGGAPQARAAASVQAKRGGRVPLKEPPDGSTFQPLSPITIRNFCWE